MGRKTSLGLSLAVLLGMAGPAFSQDEVSGPAPGTFEVGVFGGVFIPSDDHQLFEGTLMQRTLDSPAPDFGLRAAFFMSPYFALEAEGAFMPVSVDAGGSGLAYGLRVHLLFQIPNTVTPFILGGTGALGIDSSPTDALGNDLDAEFHWGLGAKMALTDQFLVRVDGRHIVAPANENLTSGIASGITSHFEALLGVSMAFGGVSNPDPDGDGILNDADRCPNEPGPAPRGCPDADGDGVDDTVDQCPDSPGPAPSGCPPKDSDGDGIPDTEDACPDVAGVASAQGCPDADGDGIADGKDACADTPGVAPDGCPPGPADADGDGIPDDADKCPAEAETMNEFRDEDGCPDEVPDEVKRFTGVIQNINFQTGSARLRRSSFPTLKKVADVLNNYPSIHLEIDGHTDNTGDHDANVELSKSRAQAVKNYLVNKLGIAEDRLKVDGFGPDQPTASNDTPAGRAKNRRIEFKLIH